MMFKAVAILGNGARGNPGLIDYLTRLNIPIITTWMGADLIPEDHPAFCGRGPGVLGQRAANIIVQKADMVIAFGARLDPESVGWRYDNFAPRAEKCVIDIDMAELKKFPDDWNGTQWDLRTPLPDILKEPCSPEWLKWARALHVSCRDERYDSSYRTVVDWLSENSRPDDVFALGSSGTAPCMFFQWYRVKRGQRIHNVSTIGAMGADIPMAIGSAIGTGRRTICLTGDGGFMLNVQELEVVRREELNVIFFVFNNAGYGSIRGMQNKRFAGKLVACDVSSNFTLPDLQLIANGYSIPYFLPELTELDSLRDITGPAIIEIMAPVDFTQLPRVDSSMDANGVMTVDPLEDMTPKLNRELLAEVMRWGNE